MINKMILQGRLTADPEIKQTQSGVSCAAFTVAWSEKYKEIETKCFQRCKAWRGTADFLGKFFAKGQEIIVCGKMATEEWEKDGQKRSAQILNVDDIHFCGKKQDAPQGAQSGSNTPSGTNFTTDYSGLASASTPPATELDGDLPF